MRQLRYTPCFFFLLFDAAMPMLDFRRAADSGALRHASAMRHMPQASGRRECAAIFIARRTLQRGAQERVRVYAWRHARSAAAARHFTVSLRDSMPPR